MPDVHYLHPRLAEIYDLDSGWSSDRDFYLSLATSAPQRILDLGCGTGLLCNAYAAAGHAVTGVDPASAMLDVARRKPHGRSIELVESCAQDFHSDEPFDLAIMTGHAFQTLLDDVETARAFAAISKCLKPGGQFVFESRNPNVDWSKEWDYSMLLNTAEGPVRETRRFLSMDGDRMSFELNYEFSDETLVSQSELRFASKLEIESHLRKAGLSIVSLLGDWNGSDFDSKTSPEMIFTTIKE